MKLFGDSMAVLALYVVLLTGNELAIEFRPANGKKQAYISLYFQNLRFTVVMVK